MSGEPAEADALTLVDEVDEDISVHEATPRRLGRYHLAFEFAAGGMATVYLAREEGAAGFERVVALKCIHPHLSRKQPFIHMFLDEARIASRINHPNVCSVYDFGEVDGVYYIAMEYLLGETLGRVTRRLIRESEAARSPMMPLIAARIMADACEGLHAAHELRDERGRLLEVIHRDVSPNNLFVCYDGSVRVVDFGIARAVGRLHETRTGELKGKIGYLSPEQVNKKPIDRRSDVWALGVVLWEVLAGKRLFRRESDVDTIMAVANGVIPPPSQERPTVPADLDTIVLKALSRDPDERYATARELGRDLSRFIARQSSPVGMPEIEEWMAALFPEELARRRELIDQAMIHQEGPVPRVSPRLSGEGSGSKSLVSEVVERAGLGRRRALPIWIGAIVLGAGLIGGLTAALSGGDEPTMTAIPLAEVPGGVEGPAVDPAPPPQEAAPQEAAPDEPSAGEEEPAAEPIAAHEPTVPEAASGQESGARDEPPTPDEPAEPTHAAATEPPDPAHEPSPSEPPAHGEPSGSPPQAQQPVHPPAEEPHPQAPAAPGHVTVIALGGWADVLENGRVIGRTPTTLHLPAGPHILVLRPFGDGQPIRRTVRVPAGGPTRLVVRIEQ